MNSPVPNQNPAQSTPELSQESETFVSLSSGEQFELVDPKLPTLTDENIKSQVKKTNSKRTHALLRQPHLSSISQILKPATDFVDSILLAKKVHENEIELLTSNLLEFDSTFTKLMDQKDRNCYGFLTLYMNEAAEKAVQTFQDIDFHNESMKILTTISFLSWDTKAVIFMGWFVFKYLEFLGFLLHGPNQPLIELASSLAIMKEDPLSIVDSHLVKFQLPLDQLNSLIKITLEVIQYICELTLLSDIEYTIEDLVSTSVYWAILSFVASYIQITLLMQNSEVALELSHLTSSLSYILSNLKHRFIICKPQIEEMEVHMQSNALLEDYLETSNGHIEVLELMKRLMYSKDGHQSLIDGSAMSKASICQKFFCFKSTSSKVNPEVLKGKAVLFFISDLDISTEKIKKILGLYHRIRAGDYNKIVWFPFVLKWTKELKQKFKNLKSKMPWYIVCYDSPVAGIWYIKGRWFSTQNPAFVLVDPQIGIMSCPQNCNVDLEVSEENGIPRLIMSIWKVLAAPPMLPQLYSIRTPGPRQKIPPSGFAGLLSKSRLQQGTRTP